MQITSSLSSMPKFAGNSNIQRYYAGRVDAMLAQVQRDYGVESLSESFPINQNHYTGLQILQQFADAYQKLSVIQKLTGLDLTTFTLKSEQPDMGLMNALGALTAAGYIKRKGVRLFLTEKGKTVLAPKE